MKWTYLTDHRGGDALLNCSCHPNDTKGNRKNKKRKINSNESILR